MGAAAALKTSDVVHDVERILAIELFTAAQALGFRKPATSSPTVEALVGALRRTVPFVKDDVVMHEQMERTLAFLRAL